MKPIEQDELIELAKQAGFEVANYFGTNGVEVYAHDGDTSIQISSELDTFAQLIQQRAQPAQDEEYFYQVVGWMRGHHFIGLPENARPGDKPVYERYVRATGKDE